MRRPCAKGEEFGGRHCPELPGHVEAKEVRQGLANGQRIQTVSFGAEMPADAGHNESAWAKNRRAEFGVIR